MLILFIFLLNEELNFFVRNLLFVVLNEKKYMKISWYKDFIFFKKEDFNFIFYEMFKFYRLYLLIKNNLNCFFCCVFCWVYFC